MAAGQLNVDGNQNRFLSTKLIARESLIRLQNALFMPRLAEKSLRKYFSGGDIGRNVSIKKPYQITGSQGRELTDAQINPLLDETVQLNLDNRFKFALGNITDEDLTLNLTNFGDRYLRAGVEECAEYVDEQCLEELVNKIATCAGTYSQDFDAQQSKHSGLIDGESISATKAQYIRAHATEIAIPQNSMNYAILNPMDVAALTNEFRDLLNADFVNNGVRARFRGMLSNWQVFESIKVPNYVVADCGASIGVVTGTAGKLSGSTIATSGWTDPGAAGRTILNKGQMICFEGVNEVNSRGNRKDNGRLKSFVVTADVKLANGDTTADIPIYPELNPGEGTGALTVEDPGGGAAISKAAFKNVTKAPAASAKINLVGQKGKTYRQCVFYEKRALTFVPVILRQLSGGIDTQTATDSRDNMTVQISKQSEIKTMDTIWRGDVMFGVLCQYPELGIRAITAEVS